MSSTPTLLDALGDDLDDLYRAGQTLTVLEGLQLRRPDLRILLVERDAPVVALLEGRLHSLPTTTPLRTDLSHQGSLRYLCGSDLAAEPLSACRALHEGPVYEVRPSSLVGIRQATWEVAAAADALLDIQEPHAGLRGLLDLTPVRAWRRKQAVHAAELAWLGALNALRRIAGELPVREWQAGQDTAQGLPARPAVTTARWEVA